MNDFKYFSMFTGVGGFELGIERAYRNKQSTSKFEDGERRNGNINEEKRDVCFANISPLCIGFSEIDKYASQLLQQRFPDVINYGDATKINPEDLPEFDMLCGGFPCQSFSIAGKRRGFEDTRGTLFFEVARIVETKRPKIIFLENVKGLLNHNKGQTFSVILETLDELGYETQWMVLNSKFFGVPQNRERVFIIGSLRGTSRPEILPFGTNNPETIEQQSSQVSNTISARYFKQGNADTYIKRYVSSKSQHSRVYGSEGISPTLAGASKLSGDCTPKIVASRGRNPDNPSDRTTGNPTEQRPEPNSEGISNNLTSVEKDNWVLEDCKIRRLTPIECEHLQGFPDNWTEGFSDTQRYKMMGNAVTVNVIEAIARKLLKSTALQAKEEAEDKTE